MSVGMEWMRRGAAISTINASEIMTGADIKCTQISAGDTAWMLAATGFVLFMTPGLAFFYGGLVPRTSVLTIMLQVLISISTTSIMWALIGFSLAFGESWGGKGFIGNPAAFPLFIGLDLCSPWPGYQMMFAVIAPALITGAFAERVLFPAYLLFIIAWVPLVYCPFVHWIWNPQGFLAVWGVVDFAGGIVVHISAGFAALASVFVVGPRQFASDAHKAMALVPHNRVYVALGTGMLWMGWFGFNGGSAVAASGRGAYALVNSTLSASFAMFAWMVMEWIHLGKPQLVGACVGAVCGLATITGAAGFVRPWAAMLIGLLCAPFCFGCVQLRNVLGWDDALDVWGLHGMGGVLGAVLVGPLADEAVGGVTRSGSLFGKQCAACAFTVVYSLVVSYALLKVISFVMPVVPPVEIVVAGLDSTMHGEHAYDLDHIARSGIMDDAVAGNYPSMTFGGSPIAAAAAGTEADRSNFRASTLGSMRDELSRLKAIVMELKIESNPLCAGDDGDSCETVPLDRQGVGATQLRVGRTVTMVEELEMEARDGARNVAWRPTPGSVEESFTSAR